MRSSKSRSRSKSNRQRTIGNIVNRVFDSSGPEGKVRGTPQQIIEKYLMLARDAQLGNDRVAAENFLQHAEHYTRMLGEAQRELAREQESRQTQPNGDRRDQGQQQPRDPSGMRDDQPDSGYRDASSDVIDLDEGAGGSTLVETPEAQGNARPDHRNDQRNEPRQDQRHEPRQDTRPDQRNEGRNERRHDPRPQAQPAAEVVPQAPAAPDAAGEAAPKPRRAPRKPRAPRDAGAPKGDGDQGPAETASAAE